jgi:hypothetical protein
VNKRERKCFLLYEGRKVGTARSDPRGTNRQRRGETKKTMPMSTLEAIIREKK